MKIAPLQAEAAHNLADIYRNRGEVDQALHYYALAAEGWRALPNEARLTAALISAGDLLLKNDRGQEAIPIAQELLKLATKQNDYHLQFSVAFELGKYYGRKNDTAHAIEYLAQAERLCNTQPAVKADDQTLLALYTVLSVQYEKANAALNEVIALENGILVADRLKDQKSLSWMLPVLRQKLEFMTAWESAGMYYEQQNYRQALVYSELLNLAGLTKAWKGDAEETKNLARLLQCPQQIVQESGGSEFLEENLAGMGPLLGGERRLVLSVLVNYFSGKANNQRAFELAARGLPLIPAGTAGPPLFFDVNLRCSYVLSALLTNNQKAAAEQIGLCLAGATDLKEPIVLAFAKRLAASVAEAQSAQSVAQEYLSYLATSNPSDPQPHMEMAWNYFQVGNEADAFAEWKIAVSLQEKAGDKARLAQAHQAIAALLTTRPSPANEAAGVEHLRVAQGLFHELRDAGGEVSVLLALANLASQAHQPSDARRDVEQALEIAESSKRDDLIADATSTLSNSYASAGDNSKALSLRLEAVELYKKLGNKAMQAGVTQDAAWSLYYLHRPDEALREALAAKSLADESGNWFVRYSVRYGLAAYYNAQGNFEKSLAELQEALAICRAGGPLAQQSTVRVLLYLAPTLQLVGEDEESLDHTLEALQIARRLSDQESQLLAYSELVSIYGDRTSTVKNFQKALEAYRAGQEIAGKVAPGTYRPSFSSLIEVYFQRREYDKVVQLARQGMDLCLKNKDSQCEAHSWMSLAEGLREQGKFAEAEAALKKAEPLAARTGDYYTTGRLYYGQAGLAFKEGHYQQAVDLYLKVVSMLQQVQGGGSQEQQKSVQESYAFIYDDLIAALFALREQQPQAQGMDIPATALESAEASKANGFLASWGRVFVREMRRKLPAEVQEQERVLVSRQADLAAQLAAAKGGSSEQLQKDYAAATEKLNGFVAGLRKTNPSYAAVRFPEPVTLAVVPVRAGETVVEFKVTDQATYVWMIRGATGAPEVAAFYKVAQSREWLQERILKMRAAYNGGSPQGFDPGLSAELFAALFPEPYAAQLKSSGSITFIPDDLLFLIPFEMLSPEAARGEYVLGSVPTSYYPSLAALRLSRAATHASEWQESFLGVGDPVSSREDDRYALARVFNPDAGSRGVAVAASPEESKQVEEPATAQGFSWSRLPGTAIEVREIAKLFPQDRVETRLGAQATKQLVLETDLNRFRYLHFATHGFLPVAGGKVEPGLVLSYDGRDPKQMMLTLSEILQLHLDADMVVLSACNTGSGAATRADGVANLGRAFMAAGASSATVSLWSVADSSTALLMEEYYRNLAAGKSKAESLARARAFLRSKGYSSPYYWAAFVLMGD
ncbi:MAG TPA: CHAT domain-containing protein [Terriglobales bacterium]|nr:CHAT domain-containing protein [Terriglobales bacterium]